MKRVIGKCSNCGGDVSVPLVFHGINPPTPTCEQCGATKADDRPTIKMDPPPKQRWSNGTNEVNLDQPGFLLKG